MRKAVVLLPMVLALVLSCSRDGKAAASAGAEGPYPLSIMVMTISGEPMGDDSPVKKYIEEYTNTSLDIIWVPNTTYEDKMNITFASGDLPTIMVAPKKTSSVINAARNGAFWDITDYLKDYPNLSKANPQVLNNISIDGRVYGVYRARELGRNGISFRRDWLDRVGLDTPETIDDFYQMLRAFTYGDPDGNGKDDTYGMTVTKWTGPWDVMKMWFGAPNEWGEDSTGNLVADFETREYMDALKFFRKLYKEGLVNEDFAMMESSKWQEPYLSGKAGVVVDVADFSTTLQGEFETKLGFEEIVWDVVGSVEGDKGLHNLPFAGGYNGMLVITKNGAKTEEDMKKALAFLDKMNDYEMQIAMMYGLEGVHYTFDENGFYDVSTDKAVKAQYDSAAQMGMGIQGDFRYDPDQPIDRDELVLKRNAVYKSNLDIVVGDPCASFTSDTYAKKGAQLDKIIEDARVQFVVGLIDEAGFNDAVKQWRSQGGDDIKGEYNALYKQYK